VPDSIDATKPPRKDDDASLGEVIEFVKAYAKQETLGPLKGAGSWLAYGAAGAFALGIGLTLILLGVLRLLQAEISWANGGSWSWAAYGITLVVTLILLILTMLRIKKAYLHKEPLPKKKS
jgi:cytochrome c biogenesis protein CcdA